MNGTNFAGGANDERRTARYGDQQVHQAPGGETHQRAGDGTARLTTAQGVPAIRHGDYPEWELGLQLFDDDFADQFEFDVLDSTKLIPEEQVPVRPVGRLVLDRVVDNFFAETEQVAFCTQNVVPGIDFTKDPLLQGRNFSYLDTQLKRLGSPNFTQLPVNAPKCPALHFQQDGHMTMSNPVTRANYEPNSWPGAEAGPREDRSGGYRSYPEEERSGGSKRRLRPESFADHYSQARQFYISQTEVERKHIAEAFTFELSKCEREEIRTRMVAGLRNVDEELAAAVAEGLGLRALPAPAEPARQPNHRLPASPALSILGRGLNGQSGQGQLAGRKLGVLVTNGADAETLAALRAAAAAEGVTTEVIAPAVGGVDISDGTRVRADQQIDGAPSVLYDVVAILAAPGGARALAARPPARDFVTDAVAHCKFIGYTGGAAVLFEAAGLPMDPAGDDEGFISLSEHPATEFIARCRPLRFWHREFAAAG